MCVCIHGDGDLNNLHIQFDTVICFFIRSLYHIIKYHLDDFIASDIWGYLADGRGMINELQENIATNRKFGTHTWYERIEYAHVTPNTFFCHFHALPMAILEMYVTDDATMQTYWIHPIHMMVGLDSHRIDIGLNPDWLRLYSACVRFNEYIINHSSPINQI